MPSFGFSAISLYIKYKGKIQLALKAPLNKKTLALAYTPGVGEISLKVASNKKLTNFFTNRGNTIAIITDGSAVLGLGNVGPEAALPVMEGKTALFKKFGGIDAIPIVLNTQEAREIIRVVKNIAPSFSGINLEDISAPKCFDIEEKLDKETDQVLIEARVLETVLGDDEKIGIDWNLKFEVSGAKRPTTFPFDYFKSDSKLLEKYTPLVQTGVTQTNPTGAAGDSITTTTPAVYPNSPQLTNYSKGFPFVDYSQEIFKDTFSFGTLDFSQFSAILEMVKSRAETSIVSNPRIATLNNTEANILIGQTLNMPKYERNSSTGKIEITGYEAKDLGIKLKVMPHINEKCEIVVDLIPEISDLVRYDTIDAKNGIVAPVFSSRQANTKVMIKDGDTIFIGGLIKENVVDKKNKMPFLGDILGDVPGVGLLFTKKEKAKQKTELIFFITVNIIKKDTQISDVPLAGKTYAPSYELSQEGWQKTIKKRTIK